MGAAHGLSEHSGDPPPPDIHFHMEIRGPGLRHTHTHTQWKTQRGQQEEGRGGGCAGKCKGQTEMKNNFHIFRLIHFRRKRVCAWVL